MENEAHIPHDCVLCIHNLLHVCQAEYIGEQKIFLGFILKSVNKFLYCNLTSSFNAPGETKGCNHTPQSETILKWLSICALIQPAFFGLTVLLQVCFRRSICLVPCRSQLIDCLVILSVGLRNVWPIQFYFFSLILNFMEFDWSFPTWCATWYSEPVLSIY
jgi:hypothetical protein